ncbi:MAG: hypothetical protein ACK5UY_07265 [Holosporales bacterium]
MQKLLLFLLLTIVVSGCAYPFLGTDDVFTSKNERGLVITAVQMNADDQLIFLRNNGCYRAVGSNWRGTSYFNSIFYDAIQENSNAKDVSFVSSIKVLDPKREVFYFASYAEPGTYFLNTYGVCGLVYEPKKPFGFNIKAGEIVYLGVTKFKTTYDLEYTYQQELTIAGLRILDHKNKRISTPVIQMPYFHQEGKKEAEEWLFSKYPNIERQPMRQVALTDTDPKLKQSWDRADERQRVHKSMLCILGAKDSCHEPSMTAVRPVQSAPSTPVPQADAVQKNDELKLLK